MPQPIPSYPYSPERKVYVKEITFDGLDAVSYTHLANWMYLPRSLFL